LINKKIILECNYNAVLEQLIIAEHGEHNILVYPNESTFRDIYSGYCKTMFENNDNINSNNGGIHDEIVILIPSYETVNGVKFTLDKRTGINPEKYEKDGSLFVVDSLKAYSYNQSSKYEYNIFSLFKSILKHAESIGKKGISVISSMNSFYQFERVAELLHYEQSLPQETDLKCKAFCSYHKNNYDMISQKQKEDLSEHHYRTLMVKPYL
jgi:hypothetical protein